MSVCGFISPDEQARRYSMLQNERNRASQPQVPSYNDVQANFNSGRILKRDVYDTIKKQVFYSTGIQVTDVVKLDEYKDVIKHCCVRGGISGLRVNYFFYSDRDVNFKVPYFFCNICGKLYVYSKYNE